MRDPGERPEELVRRRDRQEPQETTNSAFCHDVILLPCGPRRYRRFRTTPARGGTSRLIRSWLQLVSVVGPRWAAPVTADRTRSQVANGVASHRKLSSCAV